MILKQKTFYIFQIHNKITGEMEFVKRGKPIFRWRTAQAQMLFGQVLRPIAKFKITLK